MRARTPPVTSVTGTTQFQSQRSPVVVVDFVLSGPDEYRGFTLRYEGQEDIYLFMVKSAWHPHRTNSEKTLESRHVIATRRASADWSVLTRLWIINDCPTWRHHSNLDSMLLGEGSMHRVGDRPSR